MPCHFAVGQRPRSARHCRCCVALTTRIKRVQQGQVAHLDEQDSSALARVGAGIKRKPECQDDGIAQQLVADVGHACSQEGFDLGTRPLELLVFFRR